MDEYTPKPTEIETYRIGETLYGLSLHELEARIDAYDGEIARLKAELTKKSADKQAADRLFGKN
jgi:uncharacterized small protein (DUF1192 family)